MCFTPCLVPQSSDLTRLLIMILYSMISVLLLQAPQAARQVKAALSKADRLPMKSSRTAWLANGPHSCMNVGRCVMHILRSMFHVLTAEGSGV